MEEKALALQYGYATARLLRGAPAGPAPAPALAPAPAFTTVEAAGAGAHSDDDGAVVTFAEEASPGSPAHDTLESVAARRARGLDDAHEDLDREYKRARADASTHVTAAYLLRKCAREVAELMARSSRDAAVEPTDGAAAPVLEQPDDAHPYNGLGRFLRHGETRRGVHVAPRRAAEPAEPPLLPPPPRVAPPRGLSKARKAKASRPQPAQVEVDAAEADRRSVHAWVPQMHAALANAGIAPRNL